MTTDRVNRFKAVIKNLEGTLQQCGDLEEMSRGLIGGNMHCEKPDCEGRVDYGRESVYLFGGLSVRLCMTHLRGWENHKRLAVLIREYDVLHAQTKYVVASAAGPNPLGIDALDKLTNAMDDIRDKAKTLAVEWLAIP